MSNIDKIKNAKTFNDLKNSLVSIQSTVDRQCVLLENIHKFKFSIPIDNVQTEKTIEGWIEGLGLEELSIESTIKVDDTQLLKAEAMYDI